MKICENKKIEIVLFQTLKGYGKLGDQVKVPRGFARNYLIPKGIADYATAKNLEQIEKNKANLAAKDQQFIEAAEALKAQIEGLVLVFYRNLRDERNIHGSIQTRDIEQELHTKGFKINKSQIALPFPLKSIGSYKLQIDLYGEVSSFIEVEVVSNANKPVQ